ncbi:MAG: hypothetical protein CR968_05520 [Flavobacteriia bacterium]|nr:MAG: hypothetical protein CR968_05520 [Flavobacteriia bacterium]
MKQILLFISVLFFCSLVQAQDLTDSNSNAINGYFNNVDLSSSEVTVPNTVLSPYQQDYLVTTEIYQNGNYNISSIKSNNAEQSNKVIQNGDYNTYEMSAYYNSNPSDVSVIQNGDFNSLQVFGQNSLSESIKIIQNTNNQSLVIKNF